MRLTWLRVTAAAIAMLMVAMTSSGQAAAHWKPRPRPLPRGKIVFKRFLDRSHDWSALFTVKPDGSAVRQLTFPPNDALDEELVWSPDGKRVAFQRVVSGTSAVYVVGADGRGERRLMPSRDAPETDSPSWSPDGSELALGLRQGDREVVAIVSTAGDVLAQVTQRHRKHSTFIDSQPAWSPDGKRLTFIRETAEPSRNGREALFIVDADGTHERRLSPWALRAGHHPDWSPGGTRILFTSNADRADPYLASNIYSISPSGKGLRRLTHARAGEEYLSSSFSPNGCWITFAMEPSPGVDARVFIMHADGTHPRAVTSPSTSSSAPDWSAGSHGHKQ